jgi:hypothetical protein
MPSLQAGFKVGRDNETPADLLVRFGPTIVVDIGMKSRSAPGEPPDLPMKNVKALVDTGAGGDCIDDDLARTLGLQISDEGVISGVGGRHRAFIYTARLYIPSANKLLFQRFTGAKLQQGDQWQRVILGRSFLREYRMTYDGSDGSVSLDQL